jgi:hypothetical protein
MRAKAKYKFTIVFNNGSQLTHRADTKEEAIKKAEDYKPIFITQRPQVPILPMHIKKIYQYPNTEVK